MRCLYCGKGLALLKRLRGGGEFCSDAHRLKYQEEYNQLALSRLLQAQPPEESAGPVEGSQNGQSRNGGGMNGQHGAGLDVSAATDGSNFFPTSGPPTPSGAPTQALFRSAPLASVTAMVEGPPEAAQPLSVVGLEPERGLESSAAWTAPHPEIEAPAPMAGFVEERPSPQQAQTPALVVPGLYFSVVVQPEQPRHEPAIAGRGSEQEISQQESSGQGSSEGANGAPAWAGAVALAVAVHGANSGPAFRATSVEVRESARVAPVTACVGVMELPTCGPFPAETGEGQSGGGDAEQDAHWARRHQPLGFSIPAIPPGPPSTPWIGGGEEFAPLPVELGELARLAFMTEGFTEIPTGDSVPPQLPLQSPAPSLDEETEPQRARSAPMSIEPRRQDPPTVARASLQPIVAPVTTAGVQIDPAFLQSWSSRELAPVQESFTAVATEPAPPALEDPQDTAVAVSAPPELSVPERVTRPLPLTLHGFPPGRGKPSQIYTAALRAVPEIQVPSTGALPLRPVMVFGPAPAAPAPVSSAASAPATAIPAADDKNKLPETAKARTDVRPTLRRPQRPGERVVEPTKPEAIKLRRPEPSPAGDTPVKPSPASAQKTVKAETADVKPEARTERKTEAKPETKGKTETKAETKAETKSESKSEPTRVATAASPAAPVPADSVDLGLPSLQLDGGTKSRLPAPAVLVAVLAVVGAIGAGVYLLGGKSTKPVPVAPAAPVSDVVETGTAPVAEGGWIEDWAPQPPNPKVLRVLSILRGSMPLSDYRMEFEAQIESKALGWVFRALNQKNYYVTKLEVVKPGIEPEVEVVHFAMIDGEEQARAHAPLSVKVRVDTSYRVRFEALGDRFTTYVQGQKVDQWSDSRISRGGVGMYRERGESALLKGTVQMTLIAKKK